MLRGQQEVSREHGSGGVSDPHLLLRSAGEESSKRLWAPKEQSSISAHADVFLHVISKENHHDLCFYVWHSRLLLKGQQCMMGQDVRFIFFCCTKTIYVDNEITKLTKTFFWEKKIKKSVSVPEVKYWLFRHCDPTVWVGGESLSCSLPSTSLWDAFRESTVLKVSTVTGAIHFNQVIMVIFFSFVSLSSSCQIYAVILIRWPLAPTPAWNSPQRFVSVRPSLNEGWFHLVFRSEGQMAHCSVAPMIFILCCCFFSPKSPQNGGGGGNTKSRAFYLLLSEQISSISRYFS